MTNPTEDEARRLLAAEYEARGYPGTAAAWRSGTNEIVVDSSYALRAIEATLALRPAAAPKVYQDIAAALRNTPAEALREAGYLDRAAQLLEQPFSAVEPVGCPTPGACSCIRPAAAPGPTGLLLQNARDWIAEGTKTRDGEIYKTGWAWTIEELLALFTPAAAPRREEMIEATAKAIASHAYVHPDPDDSRDCGEFEDMPKETRELYYQAASAATDAILALFTPAAAQETPAAQWRKDGGADPHGTSYDCERSKLSGGHLTDDEVAYQTAMLMRGDLNHEAVLATAKDRIRWLSRKLVEATAAPAAAQDEEERCGHGQAWFDGPCPSCEADKYEIRAAQDEVVADCVMVPRRALAAARLLLWQYCNHPQLIGDAKEMWAELADAMNEMAGEPVAAIRSQVPHD